MTRTAYRKERLELWRLSQEVARLVAERMLDFKPEAKPAQAPRFFESRTIKKTTGLVCAALLVIACHDKAEGGGGGLSLPTSPSPAAATCPAVPITLTNKAQDGSGPYLTLVFAESFNEVALLRNGTRVVEGVTAITRVKVDFSAVYQVQGRVGVCWSLPLDVPIQDQNVDASDAGARPAPPTTPTARSVYRERRCTVASEFLPGMSETLTFNAPSGFYTVTAETYDVYHAPDYQLGSLETAIVSDFGVTEDVGDTETRHVTAWTTNLPIGELRVTGNAGSLHGEPGPAVCVTVSAR